jgi:hypothetical protein
MRKQRSYTPTRQKQCLINQIIQFSRMIKRMQKSIGFLILSVLLFAPTSGGIFAGSNPLTKYESVSGTGYFDLVVSLDWNPTAADKNERNIENRSQDDSPPADRVQLSIHQDGYSTGTSVDFSCLGCNRFGHQKAPPEGPWRVTYCPSRVIERCTFPLAMKSGGERNCGIKFMTH